MGAGWLVSSCAVRYGNASLAVLEMEKVKGQPVWIIVAGRLELFECRVGVLIPV
jgi:hypothetical protein